MVDMPKRPGDVAELAREAAFVAVGLGVLGLQRAQARRAQIRRRIEADPELAARLGHLKTEAVRQAGHLDDLVGEALERFDAAAAPIEAQLPIPARQVARLARTQVHETHTRLRHLLSSLG